MLRLWTVMIILSESWPGWEKWDLKSDAFSDSVAFNLFPVSPLENTQWRKVSPLQWIPFEGAHHWPPTGCSGENSEILMQQQEESAVKEIFLDQPRLQLNWAKFLSTVVNFALLLSSQLHCNMPASHCFSQFHLNSTLAPSCHKFWFTFQHGPSLLKAAIACSSIFRG